MPETLPFFVPGATPEGQEAVFVELARFAGQLVPQLSERVYSITYDYDGEEWRATVGETLRGVRPKRSRSKGTKVEREMPVYDAALVLAIFPGTPYLVVTDSRPVGRVRSARQNPFLVDVPKSVTRFSLP
jgi:hypothetical protein